MQFLDPDFGQAQVIMNDFGQHHIISIIKSSSYVVVFLVGLLASVTLNLVLFQGTSVLLSLRFIVVTVFVVKYVVSDQLVQDARLVYSQLPRDSRLATSVDELKRFVLIQEITSVVMNGLFYAVGVWLLVRYTKVLSKLLNDKQRVADV